MKSARRIDYKHVRSASLDGSESVEHYRRRIAALFAFNDLDFRALRPYFELVACRRTESVRRRDGNAFTLLYEFMRQFAYRGGFTHSVYAYYHKYDGGFEIKFVGIVQTVFKGVAKRVYRADGVDFEAKAAKELAKLEKLGFGDMPVCMAKTQYSFSDDQTKLGAPRGFRITVRDVKVSAGAGFVVALTGNIMTMPGLGKSPAAFKIDVDETGKITGLF